MFKINIDKKTVDNEYYRRIIFTTKQQQLVLMNLKPQEEIGREIHPKTTQFIRVEDGSGVVIVGNEKRRIRVGDAVMIPSGKFHNVRAGKNGMKLYTIYSPPHHKPKLVQKLKKE
jgi:mannose-6-phosphate isomerase-like protein (cupin superfamily)